MTFFKKLWAGWKKIARKIGDFQARVILMVFYFVILAPFAFALRIAGDPLNIKPHGKVTWHPKKEPSPNTIEQAIRQF